MKVDKGGQMLICQTENMHGQWEANGNKVSAEPYLLIQGNPTFFGLQGRDRKDRLPLTSQLLKFTPLLQILCGLPFPSTLIQHAQQLF